MAMGGEDSTRVNIAQILTGVTGMGPTEGKGDFKNQPRGTDGLPEVGFLQPR